MSWSWKLGRPFGIPVYVHWTFVIILGWVIMRDAVAGRDAAAIAVSLAFVIALFGCVVLHELGHAVMARQFGVGTSNITLLPIGGVARLERIPERPLQELAIALAGPAVNVVIVGLLLLLGVRVPQAASQQELLDLPIGTKLLMVNMLLVAFNLLPAFPMDGGRVLRALLALVMPYRSATRLAASIGQAMAILFAFTGIWIGNPFLLLIALFVWIGAEAEARQVEERSLLRGLSIRSAMLTDFQMLRPEDTLGHAAELLLAGSQQDFPVMERGTPAGVLTRAALLQGLASGGRDVLVSNAPLAELGSVELSGPLIPAIQALRERGQPCLLVTEAGQPVGLLTLENVTELMLVNAALGRLAPEATTRPDDWADAPTGR